MQWLTPNLWQLNCKIYNIEINNLRIIVKFVKLLKFNTMDELANNNNTPLPDISYLKEMVGDDKEIIKEIILLFIERAPLRTKELRESARAGDHNKLKTVSHSLITELTTVGILSVVNDLKRINTASKDMENLKETVDRIITAINEGVQGLRKLI